MSPVFIDGATYVAIALFAALAAEFGTDEAAKYISPMALFWIRLACGTISASLLALKMFRSTAFAEAVAEKKNGNGNGNGHAPTPVPPDPAPADSQPRRSAPGEPTH
jgi:hypothetical protein